MSKLKVLNLYAGIGGNRKLWENVEVTAVEMNQEIANIYQDFFPDDEVIVGDAHQYLLSNYTEYDFIWSSPPCPTHSRFNHLNEVQNKKIKYIDMSLYQEIILLKQWYKGKWCIENVISYYEPLISPQERASHYFWANFIISEVKNINREIRGAKNQIKKRMDLTGFNIDKYNFTYLKKRSALNNCTEPKIGLHILNCAIRQSQLTFDLN